MATVTPYLDKRYAAKDGYPIKMRILYGDKQRYVSIGYRIAEDQWKDGEVVKHPDKEIINAVLSQKLTEAKRYIADCIIKNKPIRIDLIGTGQTSYSFTDYLTHRAEQYRQHGQIIMDRKVRRFVKELQMCFGHNVHFSDITPDSLRKFDAWLKGRGNANNTRGKKFKFLRQFYDHAIREGMAEAPNPFAGHTVPKDPVKKDKLTRAEISTIEGLQLNDGAVNNARNLFLFSYYTKGSRFADCITLQRDQIRGGRVHITTGKSKKHISVKIHPRLQKLLDQYGQGDMVFPYLDEIPTDPEQYLVAVSIQNVLVNRNLKVVAELAGIKTNLTFHIARHTFAQHLKEAASSLSVVQDALGHSDQKITQLYVTSLGDEILDKEMEGVYG